MYRQVTLIGAGLGGTQPTSKPDPALGVNDVETGV